MSEDDHVYYLAQAYSTNPAQAINDAHNWVLELRKMGKTVFSPILHAHYYDQGLKNLNPSACSEETRVYMQQEDYVAWDLAILDAMDKTRLGMLFAPTCFNATLTCQCDGIGPYQIIRCVPTFCSLPWASRGAEREYVWAKLHHVKCLLLEPFLAGMEVAI